MPAASLPDNELERLEVLRCYHLLDTPPEEAFDRLTGLVSRLFQMPMVVISLVDAERQWFKSRQGLQADQFDRSIAFGAHVLK